MRKKIWGCFLTVAVCCPVAVPLGIAAQDPVAGKEIEAIGGELSNTAIERRQPQESASAEIKKVEVGLDLRGAIFQALKNNRDIKIATMLPTIAKQDLKKAEAVYDPAVVLSSGATDTDRPIESILDTGSTREESLQEERWSARAGIKQRLGTGGVVSIYQEMDYLDSNSEFVVPDPQNRSRIGSQLSQPLLRGIGDRENQSAIEIAQVNVSAAKEEFMLQVMDSVHEVINAYWQVYFAREVVSLGQIFLEKAEEILHREKSRHVQGLSKQLDVDRAISAIEMRRHALIKARNNLDTAASNFKLLLNSPDLPIGRSDTELNITDQPVLAKIEIDANSTLKKALDIRPEIRLAKKKIAMTRIQMDLAAHKKLPRLDAKLDFSLNSLGDDERNALTDTYDSDYGTWSAWLEFEWPIGNRGPAAEYHRYQLEYEKAREALQKVEDQISTEVFSGTADINHASRQLVTAEQSVGAAERVLKSEEALYELAQTKNDDLLNSQELLFAAKKELLWVTVSYNMLLGRIGRVQGSLLDEYGIRLAEAGKPLPQQRQ